MAFIPIPNGLTLCFDFESASQKWQFCFTLRKSAGAPDLTDLQSVATIGKNWVNNNLKGIIDSTTTSKYVRATDMTAQGAPQHIEPTNYVGTGGASNPLPLNVALCCSARTAKRGRSYRGRIYLSGLPVDFQDGVNTGSATLLTNMAGHLTDLQSALDTAGFDMVVPTRQHNGAVVSPAEVNEIIGWVIDSNFDSQRRRLTGRGS